jgi:hypothetical protein
MRLELFDIGAVCDEPILDLADFLNQLHVTSPIARDCLVHIEYAAAAGAWRHRSRIANQDVATRRSRAFGAQIPGANQRQQEFLGCLAAHATKSDQLLDSERGLHPHGTPHLVTRDARCSCQCSLRHLANHLERWRGLIHRAVIRRDRMPPIARREGEAEPFRNIGQAQSLLTAPMRQRF